MPEKGRTVDDFARFRAHSSCKRCASCACDNRVFCELVARSMHSCVSRVDGKLEVPRGTTQLGRITYTWPDKIPPSASSQTQVLSTDGSGNLRWAVPDGPDSAGFFDDVVAQESLSVPSGKTRFRTLEYTWPDAIPPAEKRSGTMVLSTDPEGNLAWEAQHSYPVCAAIDCSVEKEHQIVSDKGSINIKDIQVTGEDQFYSQCDIYFKEPLYDETSSRPPVFISVEDKPRNEPPSTYALLSTYTFDPTDYSKVTVKVRRLYVSNDSVHLKPFTPSFSIIIL